MHPEASDLTRAELFAKLKKHRTAVTLTQLRRWVDTGLVPAPRRVGLGRGLGTVSLYPPITLFQVTALRAVLKKSRSLPDAGWTLWVFGFDVTPFVRALLAHEWREQLVQAKHVARELKSSRRRDALIREAKAGRLGAASSMLRMVRPEAIPHIIQMLSELHTGELHEHAHRPEKYDLLRDAALGLWPSGVAGTLEDEGLPPIEKVRAELERQSRELSPSKLLRALRNIDDAHLVSVRNEAQAILSAMARAVGREDDIISRATFRRYFAFRVVAKDSRAEGERVRQMMGWHTPPQSPLQEFIAQQLATHKGPNETT
jgi:hypothetical protein